MKLTVLLSLLMFYSTNLFSQKKPASLEISQLKEDFYVFTTYRDYNGTPFPSNGLYALTSEGVVMIDTPWDTTQFQPLLDSIRLKHNKEVVLCIATHSHDDRTGGIDFYRQQGIKTYTTIQTDEISKERNQPRAEFLMHQDTVFVIGNQTFQTYFAGAGHSPDNIVVWCKTLELLYGGCLIKSVDAKDLGYLGDADTEAWTATINNIKSKFGKPKHIIPGHQNWKSKKALNHTLKLLRKKSRSIEKHV